MHMQIDGTTRAVVIASLVTLAALFFAAGWVAGVGMGVISAGPSFPRIATAPAPPRTLPPSNFVQPPMADLTPASELPMMASAAVIPTAVVEVVAASNVNPLDEWLTAQPLPMPDWNAIELAAKNPAPLATSYRPMIRDAALRNSLKPELVEAIARVESDFNAYEVSEKGALGLLQVMPETGARFGVARDRLFDPRENLAAGTAYLAWLMDRYHGDLDLALAAYNAGEGAVDQHRGIPPYRETQQYVKRVRAALRQIEARMD